MGKSITPKYRLEMDGGHGSSAWHGRATDKALEQYIMRFADSLKTGGVNAHISLSLGYIPYPNKAQIVEQKTGRVKATWKAAMFQVF